MTEDARHAEAGFTLLELLAVVAILALLAGVFATRSAQRGQLGLVEAQGAITSIDAWARKRARLQGAVATLWIDLRRGELSVDDGQQKEAARRTVPANVRVAEAVSQGGVRHTGRMPIRVDRRGVSDAYAVRLETTTGAERWVVIAGGTGQAIDSADPGATTDDKPSWNRGRVERFFRALRSPGDEPR